jgi:hypothetical protein
MALVASAIRQTLKTSVFVYPDADSRRRVASSSPKSVRDALSRMDGQNTHDLWHMKKYTSVTFGTSGAQTKSPARSGTFWATLPLQKNQ